MICSNGFYKSKGVSWVDEHAGHKYSGVTYFFLYLRSDGIFIKLSDDNPNFDIIRFIMDKKDEELMKDTSITFGNYNVFENVLELTYLAWNEKRELIFTILSPDTFLDKNLIEYNFVPSQIDSSNKKRTN